jgi:hypothetical protein
VRGQAQAQAQVWRQEPLSSLLAFSLPVLPFWLRAWLPVFWQEPLSSLLAF